MSVRPAVRQPKCHERRLLNFAAVAVSVFPWCGALRAAPADDLQSFRVVVSSFGTVGVTHSNNPRGDFTPSLLSPTGAGFSHSWSTDVDSRLGGQIFVEANRKFAAVVQVISEQRYDRTYRPHVEWANVEYRPIDRLRVRVGRTVLQNFLYSDTRKVGYANPWVRPPIEVYDLLPITNSDGLDVRYDISWGATSNRLIAAYGGNVVKLPAQLGGGEDRSRHLLLISDTLEFGAATVHLSYQQSDLTNASLSAVVDAFRNFGPEGERLADRYDQRNKRASVLVAGAQYDPGRWFMVGEWGHVRFHSILGEATGWYVSGGYRWRALTPYVLYSNVTPEGNRSDPGLDLAALPGQAIGPAAGLNAFLNGFLSGAPHQSSTTIGLRWDPVRKIDLKLQYDRVRLGAGSRGTLTNLQPDFRLGSAVNLISFTVDFAL